MDNNWKAGDIAICKVVGALSPSRVGCPPPLRLDAEYIVNAVYTCQCGSAKLDVGLGTVAGDGTRCTCGATSTPSVIHWCAAKRFVKKKSREEIQEEIDMAIEEENYELAKSLQEQLNPK